MEMSLKVAILSRNITETKQIQARLQEAYDDLEKKVAERTNDLNLANEELVHKVTQHQRAEAQAATLARVAAKMSAQTDLTSILQTVCEETIRSVQFAYCSIFLYDEEIDAYTLAAVTPPVDDQQIFPPISRSFVYENVTIETPHLVIPDCQMLQGVPGIGSLILYDIRTMIIIPLIDEGEIIGTLNVASDGEIHLPSAEELVLLKALADQTKIGITKTWLVEQLQESSERLQVLSKKLVMVQEQERRNLARELHDEIGQALTSLRLNLDMILRMIPDDCDGRGEIQLNLDRASQTTTVLLEKIREISLDLRPAILDDLGLVPALVAFFERFSTQTGIQVEFKHSQVERRFSDELETSIFRIIQEGLTNVARHAGSSQVEIRLWADAQHLRIQIEDNGLGFDPQKALKSSRTSGLTGMRERAASCGGQIEFDSEPGKGTCLTAEFPLKMTIEKENDFNLTGG